MNERIAGNALQDEVLRGQAMKTPDDVAAMLITADALDDVLPARSHGATATTPGRRSSVRPAS